MRNLRKGFQAEKTIFEKTDNVYEQMQVDKVGVKRSEQSDERKTKWKIKRSWLNQRTVRLS